MPSLEDQSSGLAEIELQLDCAAAADIDIELLQDHQTLRVGTERIPLGWAIQSEADLTCQFDRATQKLHVRFPKHRDQPAQEPPSPDGAVRGFESSFVADTKTVKGRGVFAGEMLEPGSRIFAGTPIVAVAHDRYINVVCASCLGKLEHEPVQCPGCGVKYCSIECIDATHADECKVLALMKGGRFEKTIRGMRLFIMLLQIRHKDRPEFERRMSILLDASPYGKLPDPDRERYQTMAAGMTTKLKPLGMAWLEDVAMTCDFAELICLVHTNLHGISDWEGHFLGSGLYPEAALLNHSCSPNCVLSFVGSQLQVHTIAQVEPGAELVISYTELYALQSKRQSALRDAKGFDCICSRCSCPEKDGNLGRWLFEFDTIEWKRESAFRRWDMQITSARECLRQQDVSQCLSIVRGVLEEAVPQLHPHHVILYHARAMLVEVLVENPDAVDYSNEIALNASVLAKACETELSPFHPTVAHMYKIIGDCHDSDSEKAASYDKATQRLAIAYGNTHPTVRKLMASGFCRL